MKLSNLFSKTARSAPADEVSRNGQLLIRAGFVQKLMSGVYTYLPLGLKVLRHIEQIVREEMNAIGGQEVLMPTLHPKENWLITKRWDAMDVLFKLDGPEGAEYALGPTHEEIVVPMVLPFVQSYKDLPFATYQIQWKYRKEARAKSGLLRGREFLMKDMYSYNINTESVDEFYEVAAKTYEKIYQRLGLEAMRVEASGGTFSKYSHEYQVKIPAGEDEIYICSTCNLIKNKEIVSDLKICDAGHPWEVVKAAEVGNIFLLNTKFSKPFNLKVLDENNQEVEVYMGCYGIGISRLMGVIAEVYADDNGLSWPIPITPYHVHLVSLGKDVKVMDAADGIYKELEKEGITVLWDDRDLQVGAKLKDADLIGLPIRMIVSDRSLTAGGVEWKLRSIDGQGEIVARDQLIAQAKELINPQS